MSDPLPDPKNRGDHNNSLNSDDIVMEQTAGLKSAGRFPRNDSPNSDDIVIDAPSDMKNGPLSPGVMRYLEAQREKLRQLGALPPAPAEEPPAENPGNNQGTT